MSDKEVSEKQEFDVSFVRIEENMDKNLQQAINKYNLVHNKISGDLKEEENIIENKL